LRRLRKAGFQALLAGGCVRDMLLRRRCTDYDVATDAAPEQVRRLFPRVLLVGARFGVAIVVYRRRRVEVATFRSDVSYSDGRRPDEVKFASPREDALRRDFTINGMFYDPIGRKVIDYVGGRDDLARRVVRTIAVRFSVRLGFEIDPATAAAARKHAERIAAISGERILDELTKMFATPSAADAAGKMHELHLARHVLPELFASPGLWDRAVRRVEAVARRADAVGALSALLAELPPAAIGRIARRWGASNELRGSLAWLAEHAPQWRQVKRMPLSGFRKLAGHEQFSRLRVLWLAEAALSGGAGGTRRAVGRRLKEIPDGLALPAPFVTGADLLARGATEGPALGRCLRDVYDAQLDLAVRTRPEALKLARERLGLGDD